MNHTYTETETRQVKDFNQVSIRGNACSTQLFINQGEQENLTIEAPPEYLPRFRSEIRGKKLTIRLTGSWLQELEDAISTCFRKPHIIYRLTVRELTYLNVQCAESVQLSQIETSHLRIRLNGTGDFCLDQLLSETLDVSHFGSGVIRISGQVEQQAVVLNGLGSYIAPGLDSQSAQIRMSGTGAARVHVEQELDVTLRGVSLLEYSGEPTVNKRISGPGQVLQITKVR
jgi:hypothetical protein